MADPAPRIALGSPAGRWIVFATILGSGVVFLDGTVVGVALPAIQRDFNADFSVLQWVLDAYLLLLGSLVLLGGDLGDRFGRRAVFLTGLAGFMVSSMLCGVAPTATLLIVARGVQGAFAALLVPTSLAILSGCFADEERGRAIGAWSGYAGISTAFGPLAGGLLVDHGSWRWVFLINVPVIALTMVIGARHIPAHNPAVAGVPKSRRVDVAGAVTGAAGLGLVTAALIEAARLSPLATLLLAGLGLVLLTLFIVVESRSRSPMLPLSIFRARDFTVTNLATVAIYGALNGALFLVVVELQRVCHYSALASGASLLPVTVLMLLLSPRFGALTPRLGSRLLMSVGPLIAGFGLLVMVRIGPSGSYLDSVLPGVVLFGLGLCMTVAPLTTTALTSVDDQFVGVASGVNNAAARLAGLAAVAVLPLLAGLSGGAAGGDPVAFSDGVHRALIMAAVLCAAAGVGCALGLSARAGRSPSPV